MSRAAARAYPPPPDHTAVFQAVGEAMATAEAYSRTAGEFAALGDIKGLSYAIRCASAAVLSAASLAEEIPRPRHEERRP